MGKTKQGKHPKSYRQAYEREGWLGVARFHFDIHTEKGIQHRRPMNVFLVGILLGAGTGWAVSRLTGADPDVAGGVGFGVGAFLALAWIVVMYVGTYLHWSGRTRQRGE